jgi:bifunctional DNase/RNase
VVELREVDGERVFPILIGLHEAAAIERRLMGQVPPRPQTHELLASVIEQLGGRLERIVINDLKEHTFFAKLILNQDGQQVTIDSRPSDAIALGASAEVPIFVEEHVLDEVCRAGE